jgi:hydroxyacylglutathione hydrolase
MDVALNRQGAPALGERPLPAPLDPHPVERRMAAGDVVLDVRPSGAFGAGHVPGAVNVGLGGQFASWAGTLLDPAKPIVLVADDEAGVREAVTRLARVGLEQVSGFLLGGMEAWTASGREARAIPQIEVDALREAVAKGGDLVVLDVRRPGEYAAGHVPGAVSVPLDRLASAVPTLDAARPTAVICAGGYRSSAGTSLLASRGFERLSNVVGGTSAWVAAGLPTE